jgi:hypothetical protein
MLVIDHHRRVDKIILTIWFIREGNVCKTGGQIQQERRERNQGNKFTTGIVQLNSSYPLDAWHPK